MLKGEKDDKALNLDELVDNELDKLEGTAEVPDGHEPKSVTEPEETEAEGETTESSTETEPTETPEEAETDSEKTDSTQGDGKYDGVPKGYANDPAWQKIIKQRDEAKRELEDLSNRNRSYESMLDDPAVFKKYHLRRGYSDYEIDKMMREKGMQVESDDLPHKKQELFDRVATKRGYKLDQLKPEEVDYLKNLTNHAQAVTREVLDIELAPIREKLTSSEANDAIGRELDGVYKMAEEDGFQGSEGKQMIELAMKQKLAQLDEQYKQPVQISPEDLYYRTLRDLRRESDTKSARQAERTDKKAVSKPLTPSGTSAKAEPKIKLTGSTDDMVDQYLDKVGYRG